MQHGENYTVVGRSFLPPPKFFELLHEVEALPMRKRSKWSGSVKDVTGAKRKVYYRAPGQMFIKMHDDWVELQPADGNTTYLNFASREAEDDHTRWMNAFNRGGWNEASREHGRMVAENATGNHTSKPHKVRVPTKAGEPVRA
jgi:hypothetical protein